MSPVPRTTLRRALVDSDGVSSIRDQMLEDSSSDRPVFLVTEPSPRALPDAARLPIRRFAPEGNMPQSTTGENHKSTIR
jgi:hypothetical protein